MTIRTVVAILALGAALGGCTAGAGYDARRDTSPPTSERPVNPYSNGGFSDPGPNYPATGK